MGCEPGLDADEAQRMRRAIVGSLDRETSRAVSWPRPLMLAATVAVTIGTAVLVGSRVPRRHAAPVDARRLPPPILVSAGDHRQQLQFSTPGGTRIIWVFDPEFHP